MQIIPAIDLMNGRVVRLSKGDYASAQMYSGSPLDWLRRIEDAGISRVHLVDLEGARLGQPVEAELIQQLVQQTDLAIDVGGGIRTKETVQTYLAAGARWISLGTAALTQPREVISWIEDFGADSFILGADINNYFLAIQGWLTDSKCTVEEGLRPFWEKGVHQVICTDISRDGMMRGPAFEVYETYLKKHPDIAWIASGGISSETDLATLRQKGLHGAIVGKALYTGALPLATLQQLQKKWNAC